MASQLSPRQREVLDLVADGRTSKEIAVRLGISESTVNWHIANAFERLGASSRAEAVALAIRSNGADRVSEGAAPVAAAPAATTVRIAWPRLAASALAIAIAGALLGGAAVAALRLGPLGPNPSATAPPAQTSDRPATASPSSGSREDVTGGEMAPRSGGLDVSSDPTTGGVIPGSPATLVPTVSVPPLPSVSVPVAPVATPALPSVPVTLPPLPTLPIPPPSPIPTLPPIPTPPVPLP